MKLVDAVFTLFIPKYNPCIFFIRSDANNFLLDCSEQAFNHFNILEPQNSSICEFDVVQKCRSTNCDGIKLRNVWSDNSIGNPLRYQFFVFHQQNPCYLSPFLSSFFIPNVSPWDLKRGNCFCCRFSFC